MLNNILATYYALKSGKVKKIRPTLYFYNARYRHYFSLIRGEVRLEDLMMYVHGSGFVSIVSTPHFSYAQYLRNDSSGDLSSYFDYIKNYYPGDDLETSRSNFLSTMHYVENSFDIVRILISANSIVPRKFTIVDGLHRAAIAYALGKVNIKCYIII